MEKVTDCHELTKCLQSTHELISKYTENYSVSGHFPLCRILNTVKLVLETESVSVLR
jgi:hypothetical protein